MVDRDTLRFVLDRYLTGKITQEEITRWAYEIITEHGGSDDHLVNEVLFNLVSFHDAGQVFDRYRPNRERLQYFRNWLEEKGDFNWNNYTAMFDPGKLM